MLKNCCSMRSQLSLLHFFFAIVSVHCNSEGDALHAWMIKLVDPNNLFQNWNPKMANPCDWQHITCNSDNSVIRVDLGSGDLLGPLLPQLGYLTNLQYLEVSSNSFYGSIPSEIGNLKSLISLDLQYNQLNGSIPAALGNLTSLRYLRLNGNQLTGRIPPEVIQLNSTGHLSEMNVSDNHLEETIQPTPSTGDRGKSDKRTLPYVWTVVFGTILVLFFLNV